MKTPFYKTDRGTRAGFTLMELLVVIMIIAILAGFIFAAGPGIMRAARKSAARSEIQQLRIAITEYYNEYGRYPVGPSLQGKDVMIGEGGSASTAEMMNVLLAEPTGWNSQDRMNPKKIVFLNPSPAKGSAQAPRAGLSEEGNLYDLWGNEYRILLDTDYDNEINCSQNEMFDYIDMEVSEAGVFQHLGGVMVVSYGEDKEMGKKGDQKYKGSDDVASWF